MRLERQRGVQHLLDALLAELVHGRGDLARVAGRLVDDPVADFLLAAPEQLVVLGEIRVPEHVGHDQRVLLQAVALGEVGAPRVAGEHDLEQPRVAHAVLDQLVDVAHAEGPVRHAHRQAVDGHFHHEAVGHFLELHGVVVEALGAGQLLELVCRRFRWWLPSVRASAASATCSRKKARMASQTDSLVVSA